MTIAQAAGPDLFIIVMMGILALFLAFWIWALVDCATRETDERNTRAVWVGIILLANWIGALIYLIIRRPQRKAELGR